MKGWIPERSVGFVISQPNVGKTAWTLGVLLSIMVWLVFGLIGRCGGRIVLPDPA